MDTAIELEIGPGPEPGTYVVRVLRSVGGGEPVETITLDVDELVSQRPHVEASILSSSVSTRRIMSDTRPPCRASASGCSTRRSPATSAPPTEPARPSPPNAGRACRSRSGWTRPGLAALPWEALFDSETQAYLCLKEPLVRHVPAPFSPPALDGHPAAQGPGDDLVAGGPARARRRGGARPARGGASPAPRRGAGGAALARRRQLDGRARQAPRGGVARAALHRPRRVRHRDRRGRARVRRTQRPRRLRHRPRGSPTSSTRPSRRRDWSC